VTGVTGVTGMTGSSGFLNYLNFKTDSYMARLNCALDFGTDCIYPIMG